ncbi:MAG: hypothetical protein ABFS02_13055 [Pseudomonadota bacterium]
MNYRRVVIGLFSLSALFLFGCEKEERANNTVEPADLPAENVAALATCLRDKGWVMYSSFTCSACRAQRKAFGDSFALIAEVECNPYAPNAQVDRCVEKKILKTPTWIQEKDGAEMNRLVGRRRLEALAAKAQCVLADGAR